MSMMRKVRLLAIAALVAGLATPARARHDDGARGEVVRAEVYFIPWDIVFAAGHSPEGVRELSKHVITAPKELAGIVHELRAEPFNADKREHKPFLGDYRLVIDLVRADGSKASYAADNFKLVDLANGNTRRIDERFKRRFTF
jgi:hypothetical protein